MTARVKVKYIDIVANFPGSVTIFATDDSDLQKYNAASPDIDLLREVFAKMVQARSTLPISPVELVVDQLQIVRDSTFPLPKIQEQLDVLSASADTIRSALALLSAATLVGPLAASPPPASPSPIPDQPQPPSIQPPQPQAKKAKGRSTKRKSSSGKKP